MAASRLTDEEIAILLGEVAAGASLEAVCASAHVSVRTFYRWKRKFEGLTPSGVRQLKALRRENTELKRLLSAQSGGRLGATALSPERKSASSRLRRLEREPRRQPWPICDRPIGRVIILRRTGNRFLSYDASR